jgi:DNA excision repair protein ERCC-2
VYNYGYLLDPKIASLISNTLAKECIVVFDEAHNIDNVCIEAMSITMKQDTLDSCKGNVRSVRCPGPRASPAAARHALRGSWPEAVVSRISSTRTEVSLVLRI